MEHASGALALVGPGRAGTTIASALVRRGWTAAAVAGRSADAPSTRAAAAHLGARAVPVADVGAGADLVIVATPDGAIEAAVAALSASVRSAALVIHLAGAHGLDVLAAAPARRGALHPLQSIPSVDVGLARLPGSWCAVAGDPQVEELAVTLGMHPFTVADGDRAQYHATACIASNHLVALLGQVERVSPVPLEALLPLVRATADNVAELGPRAALTGPVARGDAATVRAHLAALEDEERAAYRALAREALRLAGGADAALAEVLA